jgi:hypothetical protein
LDLSINLNIDLGDLATAALVLYLLLVRRDRPQ